MLKIKSITITTLLTLLCFCGMMFYSCDKEAATPDTYEITIFNPYDYDVIIRSNSFQNTNNCGYGGTKSGCIIGSNETKTFIGEVGDNIDGYQSILWQSINTTEEKSGILDFDATAGSSYCGNIINTGEVTYRSGSGCTFDNSNGSNNNGNNNGGSTGGNGSGNNEKGGVVFWTNYLDSKLSNGHLIPDEIHVFVNGDKYGTSINQIMNSAPHDCPTMYHRGIIVAQLTPGTYPYDAYIYDWSGGTKYNKKEWHGSVTITNNGCVKILLKNI